MNYALDREQSATRVLRGLVDLKGKDVLEVGCGDGRLTWRYADVTRSVLAIDPNMELIGTARAQMPPALRERVAFHEADIITEPLPDDAFDVVLISWTL